MTARRSESLSVASAPVVALPPQAVWIDDARSIVARIRSGDAAAFQRLFAAHYDGLCRFAERYVESPAAAEELVADVFCNLWVHRSTLNIKIAVDRYLYGAVRNRALNARRNARAAKGWAERWIAAYDAGIDSSEPAPCMGAATPNADMILERNEVTRRIRAAVDAMPARRREVAALHWLEQLSYSEVAKRCGLSMAAVKKHVERALVSLRATLVADLDMHNRGDIAKKK